MSLLGIDWHFPNLTEAFASKEQDILLFVAAQLQTNRAEMFDTNNASRTPWAEPKLRKGQPLSKTGTLRKSFAPHNGGDRPVVADDGIVTITGESVTIGTKIAYAHILDSGGVIRPKHFPVLWIPLPDGSPKSANAPSDYTKGLKKGKVKGPPIVKGRNGKYYLLAKQVTIPARPMTEWNAADQEELETALRNKLEHVLQEIFNG